MIQNPIKDLGNIEREFQTESIRKMMENHIEFTVDIPQTLELDESSNVIRFTSDNMEDMINMRYREFNKSLAW